jgi:hypothetical protein
MTEKPNNKQKNKKMVLALFGICDLEFVIYLKFGACSLVLVYFLLARRLFGGVLGICDFRHKAAKAEPNISDLAHRRSRHAGKDQVF